MATWDASFPYRTKSGKPKAESGKRPFLSLMTKRLVLPLNGVKHYELTRYSFETFRTASECELPGSRGSFDIVNELSARQPSIKTVIFAAHASSVLIDQTLQAKARGYLLKSEPVDNLIAKEGSDDGGG